MRMRVRYWSCSKFAKWIRSKAGYSKPSAATLEEWDVWKSDAEKNHRLVHWLTDEFLDMVQDVVYWIPDRLHDVRYYVKARWFDKYWCMDTKLKRGQYYDVDTRMLHGMFETLVDFVEIEKAHMTCWLDKEIKKPIRYKFPLFRWKSIRSRELGMKYLKWEMSLDSPDLPENERVPTQAADAREVAKLYIWWKDVRPNRIDPMDVSGWSEYCKLKRDEQGKRRFVSPKEDREKTNAMLSMMSKVESDYDAEDEEMLIRLVKIRKYMWT